MRCEDGRQGTQCALLDGRERVRHSGVIVRIVLNEDGSVARLVQLEMAVKQATVAVWIRILVSMLKRCLQERKRQQATHENRGKTVHVAFTLVYDGVRFDSQTSQPNQ